MVAVAVLTPSTGEARHVTELQSFYDTRAGVILVYTCPPWRDVGRVDRSPDGRGSCSTGTTLRGRGQAGPSNESGAAKSTSVRLAQTTGSTSPKLPRPWALRHVFSAYRAIGDGRLEAAQRGRDIRVSLSAIKAYLKEEASRPGRNPRTGG